ncbi:MAG: RecX family transcriptional regulator [Sphingomonas sp. 28-62-20]|uniref:regulatory protein RecX n=1 Tax=unclassified Sphingomonas TaxID=196159 RepID=UPI000A909508|nr:RecX family transcriptional regulator [Sphingomonas sp.]OYY76365.1 MAG: RecX family transcriptional regulator [Sphingomonas sp. 28-62-20]
MRVARPPTKPLDSPALERLALRYVERFATTRARLTTYLNGKIRQRGFDGAVPDIAAIAERFAAAGYIDDRAFGDARAQAMARRGLGARRVAGALHHAGIGSEDSAALAPAIADRAIEAALTFARKRRIGPYATEIPDRAVREKQIAAMIRSGHDFGLARRIASMAPGDDTSEIA